MAKRLQRDDKIRMLTAVQKRDGLECWKCEKKLIAAEHAPNIPDSGKLPSNYPTLDHIIPAALGGSNNKKNMRAMCVKCNSEKSHKAIFEHLPQDIETCHKLITDTTNQIIAMEVKLRERSGQVAALARQVAALTQHTN